MKYRSVLLNLARDSIQEVYEAKRGIDKKALLNEHPLLAEYIPSKVNIYLDDELRGSSCETSSSRNLLEDIIHNSKKAAFEDKEFSPLTTSEYLHSEIEIILQTPEGEISERDKAIITQDSDLSQVFE